MTERTQFHFGLKFRAFSSLAALGLETLNGMTKEQVAQHLTKELGEEITTWHVLRLRKANSVAGIHRPIAGWRLKQGTRGAGKSTLLARRVAALEARLVELEGRVGAASSVPVGGSVPARENGARYVVHSSPS